MMWTNLNRSICFGGPRFTVCHLMTCLPYVTQSQSTWHPYSSSSHPAGDLGPMECPHQSLHACPSTTTKRVFPGGQNTFSQATKPSTCTQTTVKIHNFRRRTKAPPAKMIFAGSRSHLNRRLKCYSSPASKNTHGAK